MGTGALKQSTKMGRNALTYGTLSTIFVHTTPLDRLFLPFSAMHNTGSVFA